MPPEKFSHSSLATWRRCRYRYWLAYMKNFEAPSGIGQIKGTIGHACLAEWYINGGDDEKAIHKAKDIANNAEIEQKIDLSNDWENLEYVYRRYFDWARQNDKFEVISVEQEYNIDINGLTLTGFIDGIVKQNDAVWILEHKFNKQVSTTHIALDMQVSIYMLAAQRLGYNPTGCIYNIIRMAEGGIAATEPVVRRPVYRNSEGLHIIESELSNQMQELNKYRKEGNLKIYRNPTKDCHWDCAFYNVCLSLNDSGEAASVLKTFSINKERENRRNGGTENE